MQRKTPVSEDGVGASARSAFTSEHPPGTNDERSEERRGSNRNVSEDLNRFFKRSGVMSYAKNVSIGLIAFAFWFAVFVPIIAYAADLTIDDAFRITGPLIVDGVPYQSGTPGPPGADGHTPVLTWVGDQIAIDGVASGPRLTGPQGPPGESGPTGPSRILYVTRWGIADFQPVWFTQGKRWDSFSPTFSLDFTKESDTSILRLEWSDNVGIYNNSWCNIGLFIDNSEIPSCAGSWSGVVGTTIFNQHTISCVVGSVLSGSHTIEVRHRSQYCVYGNYAFDSGGLSRFVSVEEQN